MKAALLAAALALVSGAAYAADPASAKAEALRRVAGLASQPHKARRVLEACATVCRADGRVGDAEVAALREVRDAIAYLRVLANPADSVSLRRVLNTPKRGIGERAEACVEALAARDGIAARRAELTGLLRAHGLHPAPSDAPPGIGEELVTYG